AVLRKERPALAQHRDRVGEKGLRHEAAERGGRPDGEEEDEECDAEEDPAAAGNGLERLHRREGNGLRVTTGASPGSDTLAMSSRAATARVVNRPCGSDEVERRPI